MILFITFTFLLFVANVTSRCPPTGAVLPPPSNLERLDLSLLEASLKSLVTDNGAWNSSETSFAVEITSTTSTFFEHYYTAPVRNTTSVKKVDGDTVFRVASITKAVTVLTVLLQEGIDFEDKISKFVPELRNQKWKDVTVGMLAAQISGAPRDVNVFDMFLFAEQLIPLGFPNPSRIPTCGAYPAQKPCTRKEFLTILLGSDLTHSPGSKAAYSDTSYVLLGYALEAVAKKPYRQIIRDSITRPLGMKDTGFDIPKSGKGIIPAGYQWWEGGYGDYESTAGLLTTPSDISKLNRAILTHRLLTPAQTSLWLSPKIFTSSLHNSVGAPWEIFRPTTLTTEPRPVDLYTKKGGLPGYSAYLVLIPEFEVGVSILVASPNALVDADKVFDTVAAGLIPKLEEAARAQAAQRYVGNYISPSPSISNASLGLTIDNGPGLKITSWTNKGKDILFALSAVKFGGQKIEARAYPIGEAQRWRVVFELEGSGEVSTVTREACMSWMLVDQFRFGGEPVDEFVFVLGGIGGKDVVGVKARGMGAELIKRI